MSHPALERHRALVAAWFPQKNGADGLADDLLDSCESRLGRALPPVLRAWWSELGRRPEVTGHAASDVGPVPPWELEADKRIVIYREHQGLVSWAIRARDLDADDPPVQVDAFEGFVAEHPSYAGTWRRQHRRLSDFLLSVLIHLRCSAGDATGTVLVRCAEDVDAKAVSRGLGRPAVEPWNWLAFETRFYAREEVLASYDTGAGELRIAARGPAALAELEAALPGVVWEEVEPEPAAPDDPEQVARKVQKRAQEREDRLANLPDLKALGVSTRGLDKGEILAIRFLLSPDPVGFRRGFMTLRDCERLPPQAVERLAELAAGDDAELAYDALAVLADLPRPQLEAVDGQLAAAARSPVGKVRQLAVRGLGRLATGASRAALIRALLEDDARMVRGEAARSLTGVDDADATAALEKAAAHDPEGYVRVMAREALDAG